MWFSRRTWPGMHVISRRALIAFAATHGNAHVPLDAWYRIAKTAHWKNLVELQETWRSAESVGGFTVFNIKGNTYRLIANIHHEQRKIFIREVLSDAEYDKGNWKR